MAQLVDESGTTVFTGTIKNGGSQPVQTATVTIDNARVLALPSTPLEVIPDVGNGRIFLLVNAAVIVHLVADYTNVGAHAVGFLGNASGALLYAPVELVLAGNISDGSAPDEVLYAMAGQKFNASGQLIPGYFSGGRQRSLWLGVANLDEMDADQGDFTGGDAANTLTVVVYYTVVTLP